MGEGIILIDLLLGTAGIVIAWLLYRIGRILIGRIPSQPLRKRLRILLLLFILLLPPGLALSAYLRYHSHPFIPPNGQIDTPISLGLLHDDPLDARHARLLLELMHRFPARLTHIDIASSESPFLDLHPPRHFWRFFYTRHPAECLSRKALKALPIFRARLSPPDFDILTVHSDACLAVKELDTRATFSPLLYRPGIGVPMRTVEKLWPLLRVERGSYPLIARYEGGKLRPILEASVTKIHWGFWSPTPVLTLELSPDEAKSLLRWLTSLPIRKQKGRIERRSGDADAQ